MGAAAVGCAVGAARISSKNALSPGASSREVVLESTRTRPRSTLTRTPFASMETSKTVPSTVTVTLCASTRNGRAGSGVTENFAVPDSSLRVTARAVTSTGCTRASLERAETLEPSGSWNRFDGCATFGASSGTGATGRSVSGPFSVKKSATAAASESAVTASTLRRRASVRRRRSRPTRTRTSRSAVHCGLT